MQVCVIGTGYVGLVTGVCLAQIGHQVICVDNNIEKVMAMQQGQSPIYEPGLEALMQGTIEAGRLQFTTDLAEGVANSDILFIAVGTPALPTGETDTRYIEAVAHSIGQCLNGTYKLIVNKSTVPIGSGDWVRRIVMDGVAERREDIAGFDVVSNPEFLREGSAIEDTFNPDRIVLGSTSQRAIDKMLELYAPLIQRKVGSLQSAAHTNPVPVVVTDLTSAEMIKYAANAFLATKISFINEVANICDRVGADVTQVSQGMGLDSRIGTRFLQAGIGWGGSCFPKDVSALVHTANDYGYDAQLLKAAITTNQTQKLVVLEKLQQVLKILKGKTIGLLGLTFKPDTDDLRDAPSLILIEQLHRLGAKVKAFDPIVPVDSQYPGLENAQLMSSPETLAIGCDAIVIVTDWAQFKAIEYKQLAVLMETPIVIDGRNCLDITQLQNEFSEQPIHYIGIGRPSFGTPFVSRSFMPSLLIPTY